MEHSFTFIIEYIFFCFSLSLCFLLTFCFHLVLYIKVLVRARQLYFIWGTYLDIIFSSAFLMFLMSFGEFYLASTEIFYTDTTTINCDNSLEIFLYNFFSDIFIFYLYNFSFSLFLTVMHQGSKFLIILCFLSSSLYHHQMCSLFSSHPRQNSQSKASQEAFLSIFFLILSTILNKRLYDSKNIMRMSSKLLQHYSTFIFSYSDFIDFWK